MKLKNTEVKKTKIVATTGPTFSTEDLMRKMFKAGVNVVRLNTSHGTIEEHEGRLKNADKVRKELDLPIAIMLDTQGPEIRVHLIKDGKMEVKKGAILKIHSKEEILGENNEFSITYKDLTKSVEIGQSIMVDDGKLSLLVKEIDKSTGIVTVEAINKHVILTKKAINLPGVKLNLEFLSERDKKFITWGVKAGIDYIAASFVSSKEDLVKLKSFLSKIKGDDVKIISKIESLESINNLTDIINCSDGIMFARGDLGIEIPYYKVPFYEKIIIQKCRALGKPIIIATQMLESMVNSPRPSRAEVTDIYYAVQSGADAIMLSGESASGSFPMECVKTMVEISKEAETNYNYLTSFELGYSFVNSSNAESSYAVAQTSLTSESKYIFAISEKGRLIKALASFRPNARIIGLTKDKNLLYKLSIEYGVSMHLIDDLNIYNDDEKLTNIAREIGLEKNSKIIVANKKYFKEIKV